MENPERPSQTQFQTDPPMAIDLTLEQAADWQGRLGIKKSDEGDSSQPTGNLNQKEK